MTNPSSRMTRSQNTGKAEPSTGKHAKEATAKAAPYPLSSKSPNIGSKRAAAFKKTDAVPNEISSESPVDSSDIVAASKPASASIPTDAAPKTHLDIQLPNEDTDSVRIYDDCDEVRQKLKAFLYSKPPIPGETTKDGKAKPYTQKKLLDQMGGLNSNSLRRFMNGEGEKCGAENKVYYHAYIFFEKLRIFNNQPKSAARLQAETKYPYGLELRDPTRQPLYITVGPGEKPSDFLRPEEKGKYYFPCEHQSGGNRRKGFRRELGIKKKNLK